jgi:hypothetical protein
MYASKVTSHTAILLQRTRLQERCADVCCHHASINSENQESMLTPSDDQGNLSYHFAVCSQVLEVPREGYLRKCSHSALLLITTLTNQSSSPADPQPAIVVCVMTMSSK